MNGPLFTKLSSCQCRSFMILNKIHNRSHRGLSQFFVATLQMSCVFKENHSNRNNNLSLAFINDSFCVQIFWTIAEAYSDPRQTCKRNVPSYMFGRFLNTFHFVKSVQIRSYFWSVFSCIRTEYRKIGTRNNYAFGHFSRSVMLRLRIAQRISDCSENTKMSQMILQV